MRVQWKGRKLGWFRMSASHTWRYLWSTGQWFGVFRNHPEQAAHCKRRWGFRVLGFEFGSRG